MANSTLRLPNDIKKDKKEVVVPDTNKTVEQIEAEIEILLAQKEEKIKSQKAEIIKGIKKNIKSFKLKPYMLFSPEALKGKDDSEIEEVKVETELKKL